MTVYSSLLILACVTGPMFVTAITKLQFSDCGSSSDIQISRLDVTPMPVEIPGSIHLFLDASLKRTVNSSRLELSVHRKTFLGVEIPIPCLLHVGSCTYSDLCTTVDTMISENWAGVMGGVGQQIKKMLLSVGVDPSVCPQSPRDLHFNGYSIQLPEVPSVLSWFAEGDYHAKAKVIENGSEKQLLCLDVQVSVKEHTDPGSGGWLLGRRKRNTKH